jgi:hypothetical protein
MLTQPTRQSSEVDPFDVDRAIPATSRSMPATHAASSRASSPVERELMALVALAGIVVLAGCGSAPTAPTAPQFLAVSGLVRDQGGMCIEDATVTIIGGERNGEVFRQATPCSWDEELGELEGGFEIRNLTSGEALTLRAGAPGYVSRDASVIVNRFIGLFEFQLLKSE